MISFHKTLAFRLLVLSFILLALPLFVDSFIIIQKSYTDSIKDAKRNLVEQLKSRQIPFEEMQPIKRPFLTILEYFLNLDVNFPEKPDAKINEILSKMDEIGNFSGIYLLKITPEKHYIVIGANNNQALGKNFTNFIELSDVYTPTVYKKGYFNSLYYDSESLQPYMVVGRVVYSKENNEPLGVILVTQGVSERLTAFLRPITDEYTVNFAILLQDSVVFAASDPMFRYHYFKSISEQEKAILREQPLVKKFLPNQSLRISYKIGFPFFEFEWRGKIQIGYMEAIPDTDFILLAYASKSEIYKAPLLGFAKIYGTYVVILAVGGLIAYAFTWRMSKPLRSLFHVMEGVQKGNIFLRYSDDFLGFEINDLGKGFNEMVDTLLYEKHLAEEERVKSETLIKELLIGQEVQRNLLPRTIEDYPGVEIAQVYIPAKNVGGDFFIIFSTPDGRLMLSIADASGKGVSACFYSLGLRSLLSAFGKEYDDIGKVMAASNNLFCLDTRDTGMFVTALSSFYDGKSKKLTYYSCGHNPGMIQKKNGEILILKNQNMAMGIKRIEEAKPDEVILESGDKIIFYTDGITEAHNIKFEEFGENRLKSCLQQSTNKTAQELATNLINLVNTFVGEAPQHDDITLLVIGVL